MCLQLIKLLKTEKAPGENDIGPEMLKAMNMFGVRWLTRVCKVACRTGQMLVLCFQLSLSSILSLTGKELELVCEAQQFRCDIVGISSAKCSGFGTVE